MKKEIPYLIYCDLDGVLADFDKGFEALTGVHTNHNLVQDKNEFWEVFRQSLKRKGMREREYWENLPFMSDGKELWDYIKEFRPYILTAPSVDRNLPKEKRYSKDWNESIIGKEIWIQQLPNHRKAFYKAAKFKSQHSGPNRILIDDRADTIQRWKDKGGLGILHTSAKSTIERLKQLGV